MDACAQIPKSTAKTFWHALLNYLAECLSFHVIKLETILNHFIEALFILFFAHGLPGWLATKVQW